MLWLPTFIYNHHNLFFESIIMVTGPSFSNSTCIFAPNCPVWTSLWSSWLRVATNFSYSGIEMAGGAASIYEGRLPFLVRAMRVNWLTARISPPDSKIDLLMKAVKNLPVKCQQVLVAICFNEKKYKDVAEEMQVSVNTVKTQLARALKLLRENLNREDF